MPRELLRKIAFRLTPISRVQTVFFAGSDFSYFIMNFVAVLFLAVMVNGVGRGRGVTANLSHLFLPETDPWTHLKAVKTTEAVMREMSEVA